METLKIMNYEDKSFDLGIDLDDIKRVHVTIVSGDELFDVTLENGNALSYDSSLLLNDPRFFSFYDGQYIVEKKDLPIWNHRSGSYAGQDMIYELSDEE